MATETINRYRKARKIADVLIAANVHEDDDLRVEVGGLVRSLAGNVAGYDFVSHDTWELALELVREER